MATGGAPADLSVYALLASPTFTGNPAAPTQTAGDNSTKLATTAYVKTAVDNLIASAPGALDTLDELAAALGDDANYAATVTTALAGKAPLASPALTGTPTAPTASGGTNTTQIATTAFVAAAVTAGAGVAATEFVIPIQLGNGVDAITTGELPNVFILDNGNFNITDWTVTADASGSIVVKIETASYTTGAPSWSEIFSGQRVTLSSAQGAAATLSSAIAVTTKLFMRATVVSATTVKAVSLSLSCTRV